MFPYKGQSLHLRTSVPLYDEMVFHIVIADNIMEAHSQLKVPYQSDSCVNGVGGEIHMDDGAYDVYFFINRTHLTYEWIGHELSHATNCISGKVGITPSRDNDEADARIAGFLHAWTYKQLEKVGLKVTHKPVKE